jgi:ribosomal protein L16/L10AE
MIKKGDVLIEIRSADSKLAYNALTAGRFKFNVKTRVNNREYR